MSCERFRKAIAGHAAGEDISGAAAAHVTSCETCRAEVERRRRLLADVDVELSRTLAITASPEFVARVTAQAAGANAARSIPWRPAAAWVGLAAAAAIVLTLFMREPASVPHSDAPSASASAVPAPTSAALPPATATPDPSVGRPTAGRRSSPRPSHQPAVARHGAEPPVSVEEPPVIVGPEQARAITRLRELLSEGRLTAKMLPPEQPHDALELTVAPLQIPEIRVPEIESLGRPPGSAIEPEPKEQGR
jgi:hypothetical protein